MNFLLEFLVLSGLVGSVNVYFYHIIIFPTPGCSGCDMQLWSLGEACAFAPRLRVRLCASLSHSEDIRSVGDFKLFMCVFRQCACIRTCARWLQQTPRPRQKADRDTDDRVNVALSHKSQSNQQLFRLPKTWQENSKLMPSS